MLIQDLQYIDNLNCANEVKGSGSSNSDQPISGNFAAATARSDAFGTNTYSRTGARVNVVQGVGSSASSYAIALATSD